MNSLDSIKMQILGKLAPLNVYTVNEFYDMHTPSLRSKPMVCVYLKKLAIEGCALGNLLSVEKTDAGLNTTYGKKATITLGISIYCGTSKCDEVFTDVAAILMLDQDINAQEINCISMEYKPQQKAYLLQGELVIARLVAVTKSSECISGFELTIKNTNIKEETS